VKVGFPLICVAAIACGASIHAAPPPGFRYDPATQIPPQRPPATVREGFTFLAAGDLIMGQPILDQTDRSLEKTLKIVRAAVEFGPQGRVREIRIYPIDLRAVPPSKLRGLPRLATPDVGERILTTMRRLSEPYGTDLRIVNGIGIIHPCDGRP